MGTGGGSMSPAPWRSRCSRGPVSVHLGLSWALFLALILFLNQLQR